MAKYMVQQSGPLKGEVVISGAKNALLPLMAAAVSDTHLDVYKRQKEHRADAVALGADEGRDKLR